MSSYFSFFIHCLLLLFFRNYEDFFNTIETYEEIVIEIITQGDQDLLDHTTVTQSSGDTLLSVNLIDIYDKPNENVQNGYILIITFPRGLMDNLSF